MNLHHGDCIEVMAGMEPESVDAIVTDPPYGLEFMGKEWDRLDGVGKTSHSGPAKVAAGERGQYGKVTNFGSSNVKCRACGKWQWDHVGRKCVCERPDFPSVSRHQGVLMGEWHARWAEAAYRVAKPSAYLLAFGGTRTVHRMTAALEDAGWIIRDMLVWAYASGFPKSKASLKPAWEPIVMARKPGPLRMLAIDECRIPMSDDDREAARVPQRDKHGYAGFGDGVGRSGEVNEPHASGRWPANVILTDPIFDGGIGGVVGGGETAGAVSNGKRLGNGYAEGFGPMVQEASYGDSGTYSRFFLIPKADRGDREPVLGGLPTTYKARRGAAWEWRCSKCGRQRQNVPGAACECAEPQWVNTPQTPRANVHPTVKPVDLMRHLVRLVTPTGGVVLDPFLGSGTTALAAEMEGFPWIGIEREAEYVAIAEARLNGTQRGLGLPA